MAASKSQKIQAEIDKVKAKISEQQARLKELEQKKLEAENSEIVDIVRGMSISLEELPLVLQRLRDGTSGQSVQKSGGFGELPNKHFHGPAACENFGVWPHPNCLPKLQRHTLYIFHIFPFLIFETTHSFYVILGLV